MPENTEEMAAAAQAAETAAGNSAAANAQDNPELQSAKDQLASQRLENLNLILNSIKSLAELNARLGRKRNDSTFSAIKNQVVNRATGQARRMGTHLSHEVEKAFDLPRGWMDIPHEGPFVPKPAAIMQASEEPAPEPAEQPQAPEQEAPAEPAPAVRTKFFLYADGEDGWCRIEDHLCVYHALVAPLSDQSYCVRVFGNGLAPRICSGQAFVVEPSLTPEPGDDVLLIDTEGRARVAKFLYVSMKETYVSGYGDNAAVTRFGRGTLERTSVIRTIVGSRMLERRVVPEGPACQVGGAAPAA